MVKEKGHFCVEGCSEGKLMIFCDRRLPDVQKSQRLGLEAFPMDPQVGFAFLSEFYSDLIECSLLY